MQSRFCAQCGTALRPQSKFCKICGAPVGVENSLRPPVSLCDPADDDIGYFPPADMPATQTTMQKSGNPCRRSIGSIILAVVLCILIFIWTFGAVALTDLRVALSEENISVTLGSVLNPSQLKQLPAHTLFPTITNRSQSIVDWAAKEIEAAYGHSFEITAEMAEDFLCDSTLLPFLIDELGEYILDIRDGTGRSGISASEFQAWVEENTEQIEALSGEKLDEDDSAYITQMLKEQNLLDHLSAQNLKESVPAVYNLLHLGLSWWAVGLFCLLSILFLILLASSNHWNFWHTCGDLGIVLVTQSTLLLLATALALWLPDLWRLICGSNRIIAGVSGSVLECGAGFHAIVLAVGFVLCAIKFIWKKICLRRCPRG